jgi:plastocyanin
LALSLGTPALLLKPATPSRFDDSSGGVHQLVIGTSGQFSAVSGAPSQLNTATGVMFNSGDKQTILFPNTGTFPITCKIHPSMQATVTVTT